MFHNATESTRRALRTVLQGLGAFAAFLVAVAIPPVGDAITSVLGLIPGVNVQITPGLIAAIGLVGTALIALVSKIQNLVEGRDNIADPTELSLRVTELSTLIKQLIAAAHDAGVQVGTVVTDLQKPNPDGTATGVAPAAPVHRADPIDPA